MLTIELDTRGFEAMIDDVNKRQIPFATSRALNAMALAGQAAEQKHLGEAFTLRRQTWDLRSIKITHFATKKDLYAVVALAPPGGDSRADILGKFEDQTQKTSAIGHLIAVPLDGVRRSKADIIQASFRPKAFNFKQVGNRILGDRGTFIVQIAGGRALILQRTRKGVQALYLLVPRVAITPTLEFEQRVGDAASAAAEQAWEDAWDRAISTAT